MAKILKENLAILFFSKKGICDGIFIFQNGETSSPKNKKKLLSNVMFLVNFHIPAK
jgi:hypothetical protein